MIIAAWLGLITGSLLAARSNALAGLALLEDTRADFSIASFESGVFEEALAEAEAELEAANRKVNAPWVWPIRLVPGANTQIRSVDALTSSASNATSSMRVAARELLSVRDAALTGTLDRADAAVRASQVGTSVAATLSQLDLGPDRWLVGPLSSARRRFATELAELQPVVARAEIAAGGIASFLRGPNRYVLFSANPAEMRAGTGMFLLAGSIEVVDGDITVSDLVPTGSIALDPDAAEFTDGDFAANWGWMQPDVEFRNLASSPRFPASAELAAAMWEAHSGEPVDGVMVVDPVALEAMLRTTGPVQVDGSEVTADNVASFVLFEQYWEADDEVRRARLQQLAAASFRAFSDTGVDLLDLATGLSDAVEGRHLLAWSRHADQQAGWEALGAAGDLEQTSVALAVLNRGANKLDPFLDVSVSAQSVVAEAGVEVELTITLSNRADLDLPEYVIGPSRALELDGGTYVGILTLNVPAVATDFTFEGADSLVVNGRDGPTQARGVWVEIPPGDQLEQEVRFVVPSEQPELRIEPSARVPGVTWDFDGVAWVDAGPRVVDPLAGDYGAAAETVLTSSSIRSRQAAVPPTPRVELSRSQPGTAAVEWRVFLTTADVALWQRGPGDEWSVIAEGGASHRVVVENLRPETEYCYRTSLVGQPEAVSSAACITVPPAPLPVGYMAFDGTGWLSTGDFLAGPVLDVRALVAPAEWTPEAWQMWTGQFDQLANDRSWRFGVDSFSAFRANFSIDGVTALGEGVELPDYYVDGVPEWARMTIDSDAGIQQFWVSDDGRSWLPWGPELTFDQGDRLFDAVGDVFVGTDRLEGDNPFIGRVYLVEFHENNRLVATLDFRSDRQRLSTGLWVDSAGNEWVGSAGGWEWISP